MEYRIFESSRDVTDKFSVIDETGHQVAGPFRYYSSAKNAIEKLTGVKKMPKQPLYPHRSKSQTESRIKGVPTLPTSVTSPSSLKQWAKGEYPVTISLNRAEWTTVLLGITRAIKNSTNRQAINEFQEVYEKVRDSLTNQGY